MRDRVIHLRLSFEEYQKLEQLWIRETNRSIKFSSWIRMKLLTQVVA